MTRTPCSNSAWPSGFARGRATGVMGWAAAPWLAACEPQPDSTAPAPQTKVSVRARRPLLFTSHLLDSLERHARLAPTDARAQLGLLRVLVLGEPRERLA